MVFRTKKDMDKYKPELLQMKDLVMAELSVGRRRGMIVKSQRQIQSSELGKMESSI
jgi:hypothetical protein